LIVVNFIYQSELARKEEKIMNVQRLLNNISETQRLAAAAQATLEINPAALTLADANRLLPDHGRYNFFVKPNVTGFVFIALDGEEIMGWYAKSPAEAISMFRADAE
jgi:hypothetical protein